MLDNTLVDCLDVYHSEVEVRLGNTEYSSLTTGSIAQSQVGNFGLDHYYICAKTMMRLAIMTRCFLSWLL